MMTTMLHRIFAAIRFVQLEWASWSEAQKKALVEIKKDDALEARILAAEIDIRARSKHMTDAQVRSAATAYVKAAMNSWAERSGRGESSPVIDRHTSRR